MYQYDSNHFMSQLYEGVYIVDKNRNIVFWNKGSETISGYTAEEVLNSHCYNNILQHVDQNGKQLCFGGCPLQETLKTGRINENEVFLHHKDGHRIPVSVKTMPLYDDNDQIVAAVEVFTDARFKETVHEENKQLKHLLESDPLTHIFNRRYLEFYIKRRIIEHEEFEIPFGILFLDIDNFKNVNDQYGHTVGDGVLKTIVNTITANIRAEDVFGRWGGEEFIIVFSRVHRADLETIAEKLRIAVKNTSYRIDDQSMVSTSISIGGCLYHDNETMTELVDRADRLMYRSKQAGRDRVTIE